MQKAGSFELGPGQKQVLQQLQTIAQAALLLGLVDLGDHTG